MISSTALACMLKVNIVLTIYTNNNVTNIFKLFKEKYNKTYRTAEEQATRLNTFVNNLNIVDKLNENTTDDSVFFIINQYADLDPEEIREKYAIQLKPFYTVNDKEGAEFIGRQREKELNTSQLFNLDTANELYDEYLKKYSNKNYTKKDRKIHFYRFVKTLVEINNKYFNENKTLTLDKEADVIKEPNEYFYW